MSLDLWERENYAKFCKRCGTQLTIRSGERPNQWALRQYCGLACSNQDRKWTKPPPAREAEVLTLCREGLSYMQVAAQLKQSRNAIAGIVYRARHRGEVITPVPRHGKRSPFGPYQRFKFKNRKVRVVRLVLLSEEDDYKLRPGKTLFQLTKYTCRFPVGNPGTKGFFFCGRDVTVDSPYCQDHHVRAHSTPQKLREEREAGR